MTDYPTPLARDIHERIFPEWSAKFLVKNAGYGATHALLGIKGCFPDLYRKVHKIKSAIWDGKDLVGEQPREILMDLIGHAFMIISLMDQEDGFADPHQAHSLAGPLPADPAAAQVSGWDAIPAAVQDQLQQMAAAEILGHLSCGLRTQDLRILT